MAAQMIASVVTVAYSLFTQSRPLVHRTKRYRLTQCSPGTDKPYAAFGGIFREEAIMLLRRFYIQENEKGINATPIPEDDTNRLVAPEPKSKKDRQLNTDIIPATAELG